MAIPWPCPLTVGEYASAGRAVEVPRPDCPGCGRPMTFEGSYPRWVRIFPTTWRIFIRRASCATCGKGHALLPDFVTLGRLDHVGAIGASLVAGVAPSSGGKPGSPADGPLNLAGLDAALLATLLRLPIAGAGGRVPRAHRDLRRRVAS